MAKQMLYQYQGPNGLDIPNAYLRIEKLHIEHDPIRATELLALGKGTGTKYTVKPVIVVRQNKNKNVLDTWSSDAWTFAYDHTSNVNPIKQAWNYLETLPEFVAALEVND